MQALVQVTAMVTPQSNDEASSSIGQLIQNKTSEPSHITTTISVQYPLDKVNLIGVGVFAHIYLVGRKVRKIPAPNPDDLHFAIQSIQREGEIYAHLGHHHRVIKFLGRGDHFVDLEYAPCGNIESYLKTNRVSDERRIQFAQEVIEAVCFIHSKGIIHSDLAPRQFLLDSDLHVKISDFGFSRFDDGDSDNLGFENPSHQLPRDLEKPSTVQSDLFALGSTLYEIMAGKPPYEGTSDGDITMRSASGVFPDVNGILFGDVITRCWKGCFKSAEEVLRDVETNELEFGLTSNVATEVRAGKFGERGAC